MAVGLYQKLAQLAQGAHVSLDVEEPFHVYS
jgi:hypothetical protein